MIDLGRKRPFEDPIQLPRGRQFVTLKDAADHIALLSKAEHESPQWQAAIEAPIMAAKNRRPLMRDRLAPIVGFLHACTVSGRQRTGKKEDAR